MRHLLSCPYIAEQHSSGELTNLGRYYIIETGEVYNYQPDTRNFIKIQ